MAKLSLSLPRVQRRLPMKPRASRFGRATRGSWQESTLEGARWERTRRAGRRWAIGGAVVGALVALVLFAPAAWLAGAVARATSERVLLADARGSIWSGSAIAVLTGGPGSRDARSLPGRIEWHMRPRWADGAPALLLDAQHACCLNGTLALTVRPGWGSVRASVAGAPGWVAQWPAAWLAGLGTPFNTMQLGGALRLSTQNLALEFAQGRARLSGRADLELRDMSSRLATLPRLGTYRFTLRDDPAEAGSTLVTLETIDGALRLAANGHWGAQGLRLRGEASAAESDQAALNNLLNIIGRRDGARSIISIG